MPISSAVPGYLAFPLIMVESWLWVQCGWEGWRGPAQPPHPLVSAPRWQQRLLTLTNTSSRGNCLSRNGSVQLHRDTAGTDQGMALPGCGSTGTAPVPCQQLQGGASTQESVCGTRSGDAGVVRVGSSCSQHTGMGLGTAPGSGAQSLQFRCSEPPVSQRHLSAEPLLPYRARAHEGARSDLGCWAGLADPGGLWLHLHPVVPEGPVLVP